MRIAGGLLLALLLFPVCAQAQEDDEWPPLSYLRKDYHDVVAVAHVEVSKAEIVGRIGGYEDWKVVCKVIEPFKGRLQKGAILEFYHGAEAGFKEQLFLREKIVFLLHDYDKTRGTRVYSVLENSTLKFTEDRARKLRLIAHARHRKRPSQKRKHHADGPRLAHLSGRQANWVYPPGV